MSRNRKNNNSSDSKLSLGKVLSRTLIWLLITAIILFAGIVAFLFITFRGPSPQAAYEASQYFEEQQLVWINDIFKERQQ